MGAGKLLLELVWDGTQVQAVNIRSTRPMAAPLLKGKTGTQVEQLVPLLFSVCGHAQGAAARAALAAARQDVLPDAIGAERAIRCEVLQEHLWRMLLDLPKALQLPQQEQIFVQWYALLREVAAGKSDMEILRQAFERDWLGMPLSEWQAIDDVQTWWRATDNPAARLLARLEVHAAQRHNKAGFLPVLTAAQAYAACAGRWDAAFAAVPDFHGAAAETGAWSYHATHPMLDAKYATATTRLLARLIDTVVLLENAGVARLDAYSPMAGEGLALVQTARGLLMHHVLLEGERVQKYVIVAPTEWNFHPQGAFVHDLLGLRAPDAGQLQHSAHIMALSLDPCVAYEIEVQHA